jgi:hypothetical protein
MVRRKPNQMMGFETGGDDHRFGDESGKKGKGGDGNAADDHKGHGHRHFPIQSTQVGETIHSGAMDNRARRHEQEPFVEDMGKGMGAGAVDGQSCTNPNTGHHISDLTDNLPAEQPTDIIFHDGVDDAVDGHDHPEDNEDVKAGKGPGQGVDRCFGGEGAHEDGAGDRRLAVGIRQPGMQRGDGGIEHQTGHDQPGEQLCVLLRRAV